MPRSRLTARKRARFLDTLAEDGNVAEAARRSGLNRQYAYVLRREDADFARDWDAALDAAAEALVLAARRRAMEGVEEPVFYHGKQVGTRRVYSDRLLMFLLRAHWPDRFDDRRSEPGRRGAAAPARKTEAEPDDEPNQRVAGPVLVHEVDGREITYLSQTGIDPETGEVVVIGLQAISPPRLETLWEEETRAHLDGVQANREREAKLRPDRRNLAPPDMRDGDWL